MQWANSVGTEQGDYNTLYDSKSHKWYLAVADKNSDGGYRIVTIGNYKEVKELEQIYNAENEGFDRYAETYESIKGTSDSGLWKSPNREMFGRNSRATNPTQEETEGNTSTENAEYVLSDNRKTSAEIKNSYRDTLGNTSNGEKILYDIKPIKKVEEGIKSPSTTTNNIISSPNENVKENDVKNSDRDEVNIYDLMGENKRLIKENEQFKADVERLKERLKIERQVTHGNYFNENQLNAVAGHLRNIANSNYSKPELVKQLKDVYSYACNQMV